MNPEPKRPLKVFLCHAHADRDPVRTLYARLTKDGVDAWFDKANLLPGQDWELEIRKAVREADVVVVCLSKQFNQAGFRQKEVRLALDTAMEKPEGEIFIIPARLEECDNLESLRKWHWVDLFEDDGYEMLMRALHTRANKIGAVLRLPQKAKEMLVDKKAEQEKRVKILQRQAKSFEENSKLDEALEIYLEIEKIDPFIAGVDQKIVELQKKIRSNKVLLSLINANSSQQRKSTQNNEFSRRGLPILTGIIGIVFCVVAISLASLLPSLIKKINETPASTQAPTEAPAATEAPTVPITTEITDDKSVSMVLVPAGEFMMGSDYGEVNEQPVHTVYLNSYYIDKFETTNFEYSQCVDAVVCSPPNQVSSDTRSFYYGNSEYAKFPVLYVDWDMAYQYCKWRNARLLTEAEWEKAARGMDERIYPWGGEIDCSYANYNNCTGDTVKVGSYPYGISPYGVHDMSGNVMEWLQDWFQDYSAGRVANPQGPTNGTHHSVRGGAWDTISLFVRVGDRHGNLPDFNDYLTGIRCASDVNQ